MIYFETEEKVSTDKESSVIESSDKLMVDDKCHVKHGREVVEGLVVMHGKSQIHVLYLHACVQVVIPFM